MFIMIWSFQNKVARPASPVPYSASAKLSNQIRFLNAFEFLKWELFFYSSSPSIKRLLKFLFAFTGRWCSSHIEEVLIFSGTPTQLQLSAHIFHMGEKVHRSISTLKTLYVIQVHVVPHILTWRIPMTIRSFPTQEKTSAQRTQLYCSRPCVQIWACSISKAAEDGGFRWLPRHTGELIENGDRELLTLNHSKRNYENHTHIQGRPQ